MFKFLGMFSHCKFIYKTIIIPLKLNTPVTILHQNKNVPVHFNLQRDQFNQFNHI